MDYATLIEECSEHLQIRLDQYVFTQKYIEEELDIIAKFVKWCLDKDMEDLNEPRCPDGKSFLERRMKDNE